MSVQANKLPTFKKLILDELRQKGEKSLISKIKSVRYSTFSMGSALDVHAVNLTKSERTKLESIINAYKSGSFNSMNEIYEYRKDINVIRTAKFVSLSNEFTSEIKEKIKTELKENHGVVDRESAWKVFGADYDTVVYRKLNELEEI